MTARRCDAAAFPSISDVLPPRKRPALGAQGGAVSMLRRRITQLQTRWPGTGEVRTARRELSGSDPSIRPGRDELNRHLVNPKAAACTSARSSARVDLVTAARHPGTAQGQLRHPRPADDRRFAGVEGHRPGTGCVSGCKAADGWRRPSRQGQSPRARAGPDHGQLVRRPDTESLRRDARAGWLERWIRCRRLRLLRGLHAGDRHQRLDPHSQLAQFDRRPATVAWTVEPRGHHSVRPHPGHRRADGANGRGHRPILDATVGYDRLTRQRRRAAGGCRGRISRR